MNWELIKEILRRAEVKAKARGEKEPVVASIHIDSLEQWCIYITDDDGYKSQVDGGKGIDGLFLLLSDLRGRQTF